MPPRLSRLLPALLLTLCLPATLPAQDNGIVQKLYDNALQLLESGKTEEALRALEQVYQSYGKTPQAPDALYQAASFHYPTSNVDDLGLIPRERIQKASFLFDRIRREYGTSPRAPEALYKLGLLALEPDNPRVNTNEAYAAFTAVANIYPESRLVGDALYGAAMSQTRSGAFDLAVEDFSRLLEQVPGHPSAPRARLALGYCLYRTGDYARAMEEYQKVRESSPGKPEADVALERLTLLHRLRIRPATGRPVSYRLDATYLGRAENLGVRSVTALAMGTDGTLLAADGKQGLAVIVDPQGRVTGKVIFPGPQAAAMDRRGDPVLGGVGMILLRKKPRPLTRPDAASSRPVREIGGVGVDQDGRIYVADQKTGEVLLYSRDLDFRAPLHRSGSGRLAGLKVGFDNKVYILDPREKSVVILSEGKSVARIRLDEAPAEIAEPVGLAVDDLGDLYLCDAGTGRVVVLDPTGRKVLATLKGDRSKSGLSSPEQIEVDHQGRIYVYDRRADAILRFI